MSTRVLSEISIRLSCFTSHSEEKTSTRRAALVKIRNLLFFLSFSRDLFSRCLLEKLVSRSLSPESLTRLESNPKRHQQRPVIYFCIPSFSRRRYLRLVRHSARDQPIRDKHWQDVILCSSQWNSQ